MALKKWLPAVLVLALATGVVFVAVRGRSPVQNVDKHTAPSKAAPASISRAAHAASARPRVLNQKQEMEVAKASTGRSQPEAVLSGIAHHPDATLDQVIRNEIAQHGASDPQIAEVVDRASWICSQSPDPNDASNPKVPDPTRTWAIKRILDLCRNFDEASYHLDAPPISDIVKTKILAGNSAAVQQAFRDIAESQRRYSLSQAGRLLFETGEFPYAQVLPDAEEQYGLKELNGAWQLAVDLVLCREQGPCGQQSWQVAIFCKQRGCPPGVDLAAAYQRDLPPYMHRAVMAFTQWLAGQRY